MAEASGNPFILEKYGLNEDSEFEITVVSFVKTPHKDTKLYRLTFIARNDHIVTPKTTVRDLKQRIMDKFSYLTYEQLEFDYFDTSLSDSLTMQDLMVMFNNFYDRKFLRYTIIYPNEMFRTMFESFKKLGITEEKALSQTKSFMETLHKKKSKFDYDDDAPLEEKVKKQLDELEYENNEQRKLFQSMYANITMSMTGVFLSDDEEEDDDDYEDEDEDEEDEDEEY